MSSIVSRSVKIPLLTAYPGQSTQGELHGDGDQVVILSNMDTNDQQEWTPLIPALVSEGWQVVTYDYPEQQDDQTPVLADVVSFVQQQGAKQIVLIGASRGGVASLKLAVGLADTKILAGVVALSAPIAYEGVVFYSRNELARIGIPKLLINSEDDDGAVDNRTMVEWLVEPKALTLYGGDGHGTQIVADHQQPLVTELKTFVQRCFASYVEGKGV